MKRTPGIFLLACLLLVSCAPAAVPTTARTADSPIGAGFRFSIYGPAYDPGPEYWASVAQKMSSLFPNASPMGIWVVGDIQDRHAYLNFPGISADRNIVFSETDNNESALTYFDHHGIQVFLQVEPGDADMLTLIDLVLTQYSNHPCVMGFGVDVEWFHSSAGEAEGTPVTDEQASAWVDAVRAHHPDYTLFLKHWDPAFMPPLVRDGILFIDDSQHFESLSQMVNEFIEWGLTFAPAPVGFQVGYPADKVWWSKMQNPPADIGNAILSAVPNTEGLFWVDFTVMDVFPQPRP